jgi:hypothetical protein
LLSFDPNYVTVRLQIKTELEKIPMNAEELAREKLAEQRLQQEHQHESMARRATQEIHQSSQGNTDEEARELLVEQRRHEEHQHETMNARAVK